jgi:hypothetical protein
MPLPQTRGCDNLASKATRQTRESSVFLPFLIALIFLSVVVGIAADTNGEGISWVFLAVVISPLVAGLIVFAVRRRK